jgi:hypothetical protein
MTKVPMTIRGAELLRAELKKLKSDDRPKVIRAIAEARGHGDLKENAEYHAAKDQQGFIEARIKDIEAKLSLFLVQPSICWTWSWISNRLTGLLAKTKPMPMKA